MAENSIDETEEKVENSIDANRMENPSHGANLNKDEATEEEMMEDSQSSEKNTVEVKKENSVDKVESSVNSTEVKSVDPKSNVSPSDSNVNSDVNVSGGDLNPEKETDKDRGEVANVENSSSVKIDVRPKTKGGFFHSGDTDSDNVSGDNGDVIDKSDDD